ncbi:MAG: hypothetical protein JNK79_03020 [Chitinophagaceae bacterium]|nr:hypothetical protein [Chitinophagaceae bacterium]
MLDPKEKAFIEYWEKNRERENSFFFQLITGIPVGLLFALPIVFLLFTSRYWFKRADMVAHTELSIPVLLACILIIAVFVGVIYKRHKWEMKDQQYKELKVKENRKS